MNNGCAFDLQAGRICAKIKFESLSDNQAAACCGSDGVNTMITAVSAW